MDWSYLGLLEEAAQLSVKEHVGLIGFGSAFRFIRISVLTVFSCSSIPLICMSLLVVSLTSEQSIPVVHSVRDGQEILVDLAGRRALPVSSAST